MRSGTARLMAVALTIINFGCGRAPEAAGCEPRDLRVLVFNIEYGGALIDFDRVVEVVLRSEADIVALEEAYANTDRLAAALGWSEVDLRTHVLAKVPLVSVDAPGGTQVTLAEVAPGCVIALGNVHLPSDPYAEDLRIAGATDTEVLELERSVRLPPLLPVLADLRGLASGGMPVFLAGDFNAPSHLDETFPWPTSVAAQEAGLHDAYRQAHPDARAKPGHTWWAARPPVDGWNPDPAAAQTRIDMLYFGGSAEVIASELLGEPGARDVDIAVQPWPSDHRGVVSSFRVTPGAAPALVGVARHRVEAGSPVRLRARAAGPGWTLRLSAEAVTEATEPTEEIEVTPSSGIHEIEVPSKGLAAGTWNAVLADATGVERARTRFWIVAPGATPWVAPGSESYAEGEPVIVRWGDAPGHRWDWVAVYPASADADAESPLLWRHTRAAVAGETVLEDTAEGGGWPLAPGAYRVVLALDDSYEVLAEAPFEVRSER